MSSLDDFAHLRIPLEDILSATDNFSDRYICGKDAFETYYEVQLLWSGELIDIYAGRLNKEQFDGDQQFWMEVSMLSSLKHKNLVSFVGFCDENDEKVTIIKRESRESLQWHLRDPMLLTWVRRLEICVGVAQALSYIHYDESRDFSVIHRNIESSLIYLNDDWEPKLGDFIHSMKIKASERHNSFNTDKVWSKNVYTDPTYIETKSANHKSDMYSFGIVLIELLCGEKSDYFDPLAPQFITHYREKKLDELIDQDLRVQMDLHSSRMFAKIAYECLDEERARRPNIDDIVPRLEKALKLARENRPIHSSPNHLAPLRIPIEDFLSATKGDLSWCGEKEGGIGELYEGQLSWCGELIDITIQRLNNKEWDEKEQQFWTQISMLSSLEHKNLVSVVGFCNEVGAETIIYKHKFRGRLVDYLSDATLLTWVKRLEVCVGVAHALSYIHYDKPRDFSVIHRNICSEAVWLNNDPKPKLSEFQNSMKIKASERHQSFHTSDSVWSMKGYTDAAYEKTKSVNHKSDIYSFGIVLFELLCGRKSIIDDEDNKYLAPVAIFHYREKILDEIIDPDLLKQMNPRSRDILAEAAYECLSEEQSQRPNMDQIVTRLEKALELQLEWKNAEHSSVVAEVGESSSNHEKGSKSPFRSFLEPRFRSVLDYRPHELPFNIIERATKNFAPENIIKETEVGSVYQGRMEHCGQYIDIVAQRIKKSSILSDIHWLFIRKKEKKEQDESKKFEKVQIISSLKHKNLVSFIGFCEGKREQVIIYKKEANGSLNKYLSDQTLTWTQRLKICIGIANALSYIHYDVARDFSVIHCNIRSSKILLDDKWEPKLSGFELSLKNTVARRHRLVLTRDIIENVYLDPKYKNTGGMTHKSDVYSFGVVLFEVLCGRSAVIRDEELEEGLLSQVVKSHLDDMIDPHLRKQMDPESFKIFSDTAYYCIQEERAKRPHIDQVVKGLEKALEHQQKRETPADRISFNRLKVFNFLKLLILGRFTEYPG